MGGDGGCTRGDPGDWPWDSGSNIKYGLGGAGGGGGNSGGGSGAGSSGATYQTLGISLDDWAKGAEYRDLGTAPLNDDGSSREHVMYTAISDGEGAVSGTLWGRNNPPPPSKRLPVEVVTDVPAFTPLSESKREEIEGPANRQWEDDNKARMGGHYYLTGPIGQASRNLTNFFAGWGDTLSFGWTDRAREKMGTNDQVDKGSKNYQEGQWVGRVHSFFLMACAPSAWARGGQILINTLRGASGLASAIENGRAAWERGDGWGVFKEAAKGAWAVWQALSNPCFAAGTPIRTPTGWKSIEEIVPGDVILSLPEKQEGASLTTQVVVGVKSGFARIWHVHLRDQVIRTSGGHPFYVKGKGWSAAGTLKVGDEIRELEGGWVTVEDICDAGVDETVYNIRVAADHTYFVGRPAWGFAVWVHNAVDCDGGEGNEGLREHTEKEVFGPENQIHLHHNLPKEAFLKNQFEKFGIDIEDFKEAILGEDHLGKLHANPNEWNQFWKDKFKEVPNPTLDDLKEWLDEIRGKHGLPPWIGGGWPRE